MANLAPTSKVTATGAAGAGALVLIWILGSFGVDVPPEVASALTVLIGTGAGYLKRERTGNGKHRASV